MDKFLSKLGMKHDEPRRAGAASPRPAAASPAPAPPPPTPPAPESEFAKSARAAASAGMQYEREIDEHTDLGSLTDQEISRLMEGMQGDVLKQVGGVGQLTPAADHRSRPALGGQEGVPPRVQDGAQEAGVVGGARLGPGLACARRRRLFLPMWVGEATLTVAFTLAYLFRILYAPSPGSDAAVALGAIHNTVPAMERAGFQRDLVGV